MQRLAERAVMPASYGILTNDGMRYSNCALIHVNNHYCLPSCNVRFTSHSNPMIVSNRPIIDRKYVRSFMRWRYVCTRSILILLLQWVLFVNIRTTNDRLSINAYLCNRNVTFSGDEAVISSYFDCSPCKNQYCLFSKYSYLRPNNNNFLWNQNTFCGVNPRKFQTTSEFVKNSINPLKTRSILCGVIIMHTGHIINSMYAFFFNDFTCDGTSTIVSNA